MGKYILSTFWFCTLLVMSSCKTSEKISLLTSQENYDIPGSIKDIEVDELNYVYAISQSNELIRYDEALSVQYTYSNERLGAISSIDVSNPLKILVFYESFQTIIVLDNLLGEVDRYDLFALGINDVKAIGSSNDNKIWLYDPVAYKLRKIDSRGTSSVESITLYNENLEHIDPIRLEEQDNKVFLFDSNEGLIVFDNLGQFIQKISLPNISCYDIIDSDKIAYITEENIEVYDLKYLTKTKLELETDLGIASAVDIVIRNSTIYYTDGNGLFKEKI